MERSRWPRGEEGGTAQDGPTSSSFHLYHVYMMQHTHAAYSGHDRHELGQRKETCIKNANWGGLERLLSVLLGHEGHKVTDSGTVPELVVVPRDKLNEVVVKSNTGLGVESRRSGVGEEIGCRGKWKWSIALFIKSQMMFPTYWRQPRPRCKRGYP